MATWEQLADEEFVVLTTFRRDGTPVPTTVWLVGDGDDLLVTTMDGSGKVKRLRHTSRVEIVPSGRMGEVADGETPVAGDAELFSDEAGIRHLRELLVEKYPMAQSLMSRQRTGVESRPRVGIRIRRAG